MRRTNRNQKPKRKVTFIPTSDEERKHLSRLVRILQKKRYGDWERVAKKLNLSRAAVEKAFDRVYSPNHLAVVNALELIIEDRRKALTDNQ